MNREFLHIICSVIVLVPIILIAVLIPPQEAMALSLFTPFGGRVVVWTPEAAGCIEITTAIAVATLGTVIVTIEELKVGRPKGGTFGILRIDGFTIPGLTKIYKSRLNYRVPGTWVIGNSFNLCGGGMEGVIGKIAKAACDITASACPIGNLIHKMGAGGLFGAL